MIREDKQRKAIREELLSTAQHYAKQGYWELDVADGRLTLSETLHHLLGGPKMTIQPTIAPLITMVNPADRDKLAAALQRLLDAGSPETIEHRITGFDGEEKPSGSPARG